MLKKLKKGFTITELVIVIAVIAILAAVLIPTFSNVISKANESAAMQNCRSAISDYASPTNGLVVSEGKDQNKDYYYLYLNGGVQLLGTGKTLTTQVNAPTGGYDAETTYAVKLKVTTKDNKEVTLWEGQDHDIYVETKEVSPIVLASKPVSINGTYYISVFLYQPLKVNEGESGLTNYYSTAYVYTGTYFSFTADDMAGTTTGEGDDAVTNGAFSLSDTFTVTLEEKTASTTTTGN